MVTRQTEFSDVDKLEDLLSWMESNALPTFNETLARSDINARRRSLSSYSRFKTQLKVMFLRYTLGYSLDSIQGECQKMIDYLEYHLGNRVQPLDMDFDQYVLVVWALSASYLFNLKIQKDLIVKLPFTGQDLFLDRLVNCFSRGHIPKDNVAFPNVYKPLCEALGQYDNEARNRLVSQFLDSYFHGLREEEAFWYGSHREEDPSFFHHFGYWVFELGALVVDIDWDDSEFRDHPLYPKDLVDWKRAKKST